MLNKALGLLLLGTAAPSIAQSISSQGYTWANVKIGGGGGFVPDIVFNPSEKGLAYARTDIGGVYKLNSDDSWTPLVDFADNVHWDYWGSDALATDPVNTNRVYVAVGMYTNSWDPNNGSILASTDYGQSWTANPLPFKVGGNMPGRGMGERLAVDPNSNNILFFGARSGNGLWKSSDYGSTWTKVSSFTTVGTYVPDPTDTTGLNSDIIGVAWVTFDSTSGTKGTATPRIFVGVASLGSTNVLVSEDSGATWNAVPGQNTTYMPHKGVLSPAEKSLYISYSNGAGPYDGTLGSVFKYNISSSTWTDITPVTGSDLYFGFGGLALDLQNPGTVMVAALNSWWPDGQIFRSTDGGSTWSALWAWGDYPTIYKYYTYDDTLAPWIGPDVDSFTLGTLQIGWMMEGLSIDPFDSNHWLYGTGETIYGGHDLLKWDTTHNVTLKSLADGIEEESVQALISPPTGPSLISAVGDDGGFVHTSLTTAPSQMFQNPVWSTTVGLDFAGNDPTNIVRIGNGDSSSGKQVALSTDSGNTWSQDYGAADNVTGGRVALSANGDTVLWISSSNGSLVSQYTNPFTAVPTLPNSAVIASDKLNNSIFYGASGSSFYLSTDGGHTFSVAGKIGSSTSPFSVVVNLDVSGDVWVSSDKGIFHTTNFGTTFTQLSGVTEAWGIALGAPATSGGYPALFAAATIGSQYGYFRSDNQGASWVQINDAGHGFGSLSANCISGDPRIYGRVYIGTNGRGIFYGDVSGSISTTTTTSSTKTSTTTSSTSKTSTTSTSSTKTTTTTTSTSKSTSTSTSSSKSTSKTTSSSTSKTTSTSTTTAPTATATPWGQCGGNNWTGPTGCSSGYHCVYSNPWYSQCIPTSS